MTLSANKLKRAVSALRAERSQRLSMSARNNTVRAQAAAFVAESEGLEGYSTTAAEVVKAGEEVGS